jgi:rhodanese-related sulfurtransferase
LTHLRSVEINVKFIIDNWMLLLVAFSSGAMLLWPQVAKGVRGGTLSATGAVQLINREKAVVIDVSETEEFAKGHVGGAKNIPLNQLEAQLPTAVKNKALPVILVCPTGTRSSRALAVAKQLGFDNAQSLTGGLTAWREANLPVEKA